MAQVFISYARRDQDFVLRLAQDLRRNGVHLWMDQLDIISDGERWDDQVQAALETCPYFLAILSPSAVSSQNVKDELSFALDERKKIIPVLYQNCNIPFRIRRFQHIDFRADYDEALIKLQNLLPTANSVEQTSTPEVETPTQLETAAPVPSRVHRRLVETAVIEDAELITTRTELKRQLAAGAYRTLLDKYLDGTGRLIQKLTRSWRPPSFWVSAAVIILVTLLVSLLIAISLDEFDRLPPSVQGNLLVWLLQSVGLLFAFLIGARISSGIFSTSLHNHLLDAIESTADLADLQHWLASVFGNVKRSLFLSLTVGILLGLYNAISFSILIGFFTGFGLTAANILFLVQFWIVIFSLLSFFLLPVRLSRYQFKLYAVDPSSSKIIGHLSDMLTKVAYTFSILSALYVFTLLISFPILFICFPVVLGSGPAIALLMVSHYALAKIITRAKRKSLDGIQANIEELEIQSGIPDEKTVAHLAWLRDKHDQIKSTPNNALNLQRALHFLIMLLLPILAFFLTNLDKMLNLFFG